MKGYALLVGVNKYSTQQRKFGSAVIDVNNIESAILQGASPTFEPTIKLTSENATIQQFKDNVTEIIGKAKMYNGDSFVLIHYTGHAAQYGDELKLYFFDNQISESDFLNIFASLQLPKKINICVIINSCYSDSIINIPINPQPEFNSNICFITSVPGTNTALSSQNNGSPTYFVNSMINFWESYNHLGFNYEEFIDLLKRKLRSDLHPTIKLFYHPDTLAANSFFKKTVPFKFTVPYTSIPSPNVFDLKIKQTLVDNRIIIDFISPHESLQVLTSFTFDVVYEKDNPYFKELKSRLNSYDWTKINYLSVVLINNNLFGKDTTKLPYELRYVEVEDPNPALSNGLIAVLNTDNGLSIEAHDRTSGRVTNKIGGL